MKTFTKGIIVLLLSFLFQTIGAKVKLPSLVGDNMVLQQLSEIKIWGESSPMKNICLEVSWSNEKYKVRSDDAGKWELFIRTPSAGGPYNIRINDGEDVIINNVYIGEVWLCSGQSNMEMPIKGFPSQPVLSSNQIIADADPTIPIHMFTVQRNASKVLESNVIGKWSVNDGQSVADFSAAAYFFGLQLHSVLKVPIGLISTSWGASNIESWMPSTILKKEFPDVSLEHFYKDIDIKVPQQTASLLYNGMLYPLRDYRIKGTIWYQGEANRMRSAEYEKLFVSFVSCLRNLFSSPDMPFYYAQIAPFGYNDKSCSLSGALLREAQLKCENKINHSGMAVLMDVGENDIIHPSNKEIVGKRLAYWALKNDYNKPAVEAQSPTYSSCETKGNRIILNFDNVGLGLTSFGKPLNCFEIAGDDNRFYKAEARIIGNKVEVWSDSVKSPISVRYAFRNYVKGDLYGVNGLPVSSFRTNF
ncbi:sialate O-acetylesterase [uncultured Bacteroides sp.]|mgnify:CR=1 FL=1|uniref:sialate O-acetylesterase n=1 Tax=uncultured Bacteroides sp. TaxID=162156 RepID=UPI00261E1376|nr:sialate O-acetylesterase [uncultured Bacteroides sp.]